MQTTSVTDIATMRRRLSYSTRERPTERRERYRQNARVLAHAGLPRVYRLHRRWDAVEASYGEPVQGPEGAS